MFYFDVVIYTSLISLSDFRLYMYQNHNWLLEGYYGLGEKLAEQKIREVDQAIWRNEGKL